jgi:hypothetical protein
MKLTLKSETLAELSSSELALVAGGQTLTGLYPTGPDIKACVIAIVTILPDPA